MESISARAGELHRHRFIPGLESVRGLAALAVCLFHVCTTQVADAPLLREESWLRVLFNGHGAVVLFFVLSGFVLRLSLSRRFSTPVPTVALDFAIGRLFRLFPVIIASVLLIAAVQWFCCRTPGSLLELIRNAILLDINIDPPFWTLQVEVLGSLLILLAYLTERAAGLGAVVLVTIALVGASFLGHSWSPRIPFLYPFLFGYIFAAKPSLGAQLERHGGMVLAIALVMFYTAAAVGYVLKQWLLLLTVTSASLIVAVLSTNRYRGALKSPAIRALGTLSFSFYALHLLGLRAESWLGTALTTLRTPHVIVVVVSFLIAPAVALLLAILMHLTVERPGLALGRRLRARLR